MKNPKYHVQIKQDGTSWTSEIVRKVSKTQFAVSKSQEGFATEKEAQTWGETELKSFLNNLSDRNQRRATKRS
ncbi:MAG: DUF3622 domain-containing protein [Oceanicoccus sp.]